MLGSSSLRKWAYMNGVELDVSQPRKLTDNAMIEAFNARLQEGCLNESSCLSLEDARQRKSWGGAGTTTVNVPTVPWGAWLRRPLPWRPRQGLNDPRD